LRFIAPLLPLPLLGSPPFSFCIPQKMNPTGRVASATESDGFCLVPETEDGSCSLLFPIQIPISTFPVKHSAAATVTRVRVSCEFHFIIRLQQQRGEPIRRKRDRK
jgi:hypothetical protein